MADIDLSGADQNSGTAGNFNPIGSGHFTAYLEGNGYTINNLNIDITGVPAGDNDANDAAFIASCRGVVSNLVLADAVINGRRRVAVLCATMTGGAARNVHIIDASIRQDNASTNVGDVFVGGLVGFMDNASISNSIATGDVSGSHSSNRLNVGGLVGLIRNSSSSISNSIATGDVSAFASNNEPTAGGLVGRLEFSSSISNSYATGDVSASYTDMASSYAGGLVGLMSSGSISNSTATGDVFSSCSHASSYAIAGGLVGRLASSNISNSTATGDVLASFMSGFFLGGLVGEIGSSSISNSYYNSEAMQVRNGAPRGSALLRGVGSDASATGVTAQTLSQIQLLPATDSDNDSSTPQLNWDDTNHWAQVGTAGKFPLLRYADNPHTGANECEFLPDYDHVNDMNCITGGTICCGEELPNQELYRASGNLTFSNTTIGIPTTSSTPEFFYNVSATTVTVTYNLATGVTLTASGVEQEDGTATTNVSWSQGTNAGTISDIDANDTFWLALTFQQGSVTHKVRWKFVRPAS